MWAYTNNCQFLYCSLSLLSAFFLLSFLHSPLKQYRCEHIQKIVSFYTVPSPSYLLPFCFPSFILLWNNIDVSIYKQLSVASVIKVVPDRIYNIALHPSKENIVVAAGDSWGRYIFSFAIFSIYSLFYCYCFLFPVSLHPSKESIVVAAGDSWGRYLSYFLFYILLFLVSCCFLFPVFFLFPCFLQYCPSPF